MAVKTERERAVMIVMLRAEYKLYVSGANAPRLNGI